MEAAETPREGGRAPRGLPWQFWFRSASYCEFGMPAKTPRIFQQRLREAREMRLLSQEELARRTGLKQPVVSLYESGSRRPSFRNLGRLADALEVTADYLIGRSNNPGIHSKGDDAMLRDYGKLSAADREIARGLIAQLAKRRRPGSRGSA